MRRRLKKSTLTGQSAAHSLIAWPQDAKKIRRYFLNQIAIWCLKIEQRDVVYQTTAHDHEPINLSTEQFSTFDQFLARPVAVPALCRMGGEITDGCKADKRNQNLPPSMMPSHKHESTLLDAAQNRSENDATRSRRNHGDPGDEVLKLPRPS
jgi:hypothetical protein